MAKGVFTTRVSPSYDDVLEERYHFPRTYLRQVEATVGDWIVYYEPRRSGVDSMPAGRQAYFAMARVDSIVVDRRLEDHFFANVSGYLGFTSPVPFREDSRYYELALQRDDGGTNRGAFGRSVRNLANFEFEAILNAGFTEELPHAHVAAAPRYDAPGFEDDQAPFERPVIERLIARPFRDEAFRHLVRTAYDKRCAVTGLRLINGGGRPEVQAAHIRAVEDNGPDSVRNGLALSGTVHWMFDRGLISVDENYRLLAPSRLVPEEMRNFVRHGSQLRLPTDPTVWPHQKFLEFHRQNRFKG